MKSLMSRIKAFALLLAVAAYGGAWADFAKPNPVTGETENYTWKFVGTDAWNGTGNWQDSSGANPSGTPAKSGENTWDPILFDGDTININATMSVEGWNLRMGLYNGANVTMNTFVKYQGDTTMWMTVDETSQLTIGGFGGGNITDGQAIKLSVARANGIAWNVDLTSVNANNTFEYYLKGAGSVSYQAVSAAYHKIKMADVTLTGTSQVSSKTLVSFTSSTPTFTADASIKIKDSEGNLVCTKALSSVTSGSTTLTGSEKVGTCELVQTSTGIVLYYVDGDPAEAAYTPSININFTNDAGNGLTTSADVGLDGYAVPGTSWNNFVVADNATFNTVNAIDSTGAASVASGVSVSISGTRGHWNCANLTPASNPLHGYIDESAGGPTPTVTITGIPYEHYRVIVYHSTDQDGAQFGYDTINGFNFTYVNGVQQTGTTSWGNAGASNSAEPIEEGVNTLVSAVLTGDTVTMVAHRIGGGTPSARGCFAAIQVVEYVPEVGENDLEIAVDGATEYAVNEEKNLSGTVYLTGSGTLTLSGSEKITAATIDVAKDVVLNVNADRLDATTFTGAGMVVYNGSAPVTGKGWTAIGWSGTVWVKNISNLVGSSFDMNEYGNNSSTLKVSMLKGWINTGTTDVAPALELDGDCEYALWLSNGNGYNSNNGSRTQLRELKGSGLLKGSDSAPNVLLLVKKWDNFSGSFELNNKIVVFGSSLPTQATVSGGGYVVVNSGSSVEIPSGKTWSVNNGFIVNGTLTATGSMAATTGSTSTSLVKGSGTVVFDGKAPSPTADAWWKNANWAGTVEIKNHNFNANIQLALYGNTGSKVCMNGTEAYLALGNDAHNIGELIIGSGGFTQDGNYTSSDVSITVPSKVTGSGTYNLATTGIAKKTVYLTGDLSEFDGYLSAGGDNSRFVVGSTSREFVASSVVVGNGKVLSLGNFNNGPAGGLFIDEGGNVILKDSGFLWTTGGIVVDGTFTTTGRDRWGGGTNMTLGDTGVLELTSTANAEDYSDYSTVTGTGMIKYSSTAGWRTFPSDDAKMPATTLTVQVELADSLIITKNNNGTTTIGNLAGSKNIRSDWNATSGGANDRTLTVTQSKDTEWSGKFVSNRITQFNVGGTGGTLTLSGTQDVTIPATISGSVNLTGTWVGATTVSGTFGGTGTLTGNLTFSDGATFKAADTALTVSGTVTLPTGAGETLTIDATGLDADEVTILSSSSITTETNVSKVTVANGLYNVTPVAGALKLVSYGYMDGSTAVITNTTSEISIPSSATLIKVTPTSDETTFTGITVSNIGTLNNVQIWTSGSNGANVTQAFVDAQKIGQDTTGKYLIDMGDGTYKVKFMLDESKSVNGVSVKPEVDTATTPMAVASANTTFTVKTIPGLYYGVVYGATADGTMKVESGNVVQAETSSTSLQAPVVDSGVRYFKIAVSAYEDGIPAYPAE